MDIGWAKDGEDGLICLLQARPETVKIRSVGLIEKYVFRDGGPVLAEGRSVGQRIGAGATRIVSRLAEMKRIWAGDVLMTNMTDPDWLWGLGCTSRAGVSRPKKRVDKPAESVVTSGQFGSPITWPSARVTGGQ